MIKINEKVLTTEEVIALLKEETGSGKMTSDIEFRLLENYESVIKVLNDQDEARYVKKYQSTYGMANMYTRRNFKNGGSETVIYYTNIVKDVKGDRYHTDNLNKIDFHHGHLTVRAGQEDLLLFMRINERNKTNPYWAETDGRGNQKYMPQGAFNYKEIIPEVESEEAYNEYYDGLRAQAAVVNPERIPLATAIVMAEAYNMQDARFKGEKAVRLFLAAKAKANPVQFLADMESASFELRAKVNSAFMYGILIWDMPYVKWGKKKDTETRILTVPAGKDHVDYMVLWLREVDKSGVLDELKSALERAQLKEHSITVGKEEGTHNEFLQKLGVASLEEAAAIIRQSKNSTSDNILVKDIIENIANYDTESLSKIDTETLRAVAKHYGIKGAHLMKPENMVEKILAEGKKKVVVSN
jgi:hypothetical protein